MNELRRIGRSAAMVLACCAASAAPAAAQTASIPLHATTGNKAGYSIVVSVAGGPQRPLLFDTGSVAMWIYADSIGKDYRDTGIVVNQHYPSGITYRGTLVYATVDFGGGLQTASIPVALVQAAGCADYRPHCPAEPGSRWCPSVQPGPNAGVACLEAGRGLYGHLGGAPWIFPVDAGHSFYSVLLGIAQPWASAYTVTPGAIEYGLDPSGFTKIPMAPGPQPKEAIPSGATGWSRAGVTMCFTIDDALHDRCVPTYFDTGASFVTLQGVSGLPLVRSSCGSIVRSGLPVHIALPDGTPVDSFQTGTTPNWDGVRVGTAAMILGDVPTANLGLTPFNRYDVLFDDKNGYVGLRRLATPAAAGETGCGGG